MTAANLSGNPTQTPPSQLCTSGSVAGSSVSNGIFNWNCQGSNGGGSTACLAPLILSDAASQGYTRNVFHSGPFTTTNVDMNNALGSNATKPIRVPAGMQWFFTSSFWASDYCNASSPTQPAGSCATLNANGSVTLNGTTISSYYDSPSDVWHGVSFGNGAYFEATLSFDPTQVTTQNGWPAWWLSPIEFVTNNANWFHNNNTPQPAGNGTAWPGINGATHYIEVDAFEFFSFNPSNLQYLATVHDWTNYGSVVASITGSVTNQSSTQLVVAVDATSRVTSGMGNDSLFLAGSTLTINFPSGGLVPVGSALKSSLTGVINEGSAAGAFVADISSSSTASTTLVLPVNGNRVVATVSFSAGGNFSNSGNAVGYGNVALTNGGVPVPHRYGLLWVPATSSSDGSIKYYLDGVLQVTQVWGQFNCAAPPQSPLFNQVWKYGVLDCQHLALILDTGAGKSQAPQGGWSGVQPVQNGYAPNNPMTVYSVDVWQAGSGTVLAQ